MKALSRPTNDKDNKFQDLFGDEIFKGLPLSYYAEQLFYSGMNQMIENYTGGSFDFIEIIEADVEIEKNGFFPILDDNEQVELDNHFGMTRTLSLKAASLVVWLVVIEQIAQTSSEEVSGEVIQRIYRTMQDIQYCYSTLVDQNGNKLFSDEDCSSIYQLLD